MNMNMRQLDARFLVSKPVLVTYSSIAFIFFGVGMGLILMEVLFFDTFSRLAHTSFTTRHVLGFHLFPSEIWFIILGNALLFLAIGNGGLLLPKSLLSESRPLLIVLGSYSLWFVYGSLAGNSWALQEFREMAFTGLSLPPILFFGSHLRITRVFGIFVVIAVVSLLLFSLVGPHNSALMVGTLGVSYYALKLLYRNVWAVFGLTIASLPFLIKFAKPMIALFAFCFAASFLLAGYLNPRSTNWVLSRFKLRMATIALCMLAALTAIVFLVNHWTGGAIEQIVRYYFLKERFTASGGITYGDFSGGRLAIWRAAIDSWVERPLLGYGLGAEVEAFASGWISKVQYHSYLIQALHNTGLIGFVLIVGGWTLWILRTLRKVFSVVDIDEKIALTVIRSVSPRAPSCSGCL
jgi:O-antigen ligase